jgi:transcriptional regulator with XRE-family HTH domain
MSVPAVITRKFSGPKLKEVRREHRRRQQEVAGRSGIPLDTYRQYESGRVTPSADRLAALASVLNVPMDALFAEVKA